MKKRIIALTLALVMLATLVACSSKEETGDTTLENTEITVAITSHPNWPYREDWASWKYVKEKRNILEISEIMCYYTNRQKDTNYSICMRKALVRLHQGFSIPFCQGGLIPRLATAYYLHSTICKYSRQLYLP